MSKLENSRSNIIGARWRVVHYRPSLTPISGAANGHCACGNKITIRRESPAKHNASPRRPTAARLTKSLGRPRARVTPYTGLDRFGSISARPRVRTSPNARGAE